MRVIIAEDSVLLREGIARLLADAGIDVVAQCSDAESLVSAVIAHEPDAVITDIKMPPAHREEGLEAAEHIKDRFPDMGVVVLSQYVEARYAMKLMNVGSGVGYLLKEGVGKVDDFVNAVVQVAEGGSVVDHGVVTALLNRERSQHPLAAMTTREREVLALMAEGRSNQAISASLSVSAKTVETHIGRKDIAGFSQS